jgi:hypothetical protein
LEYDILPRGEFDFVASNYYSPIPKLSTLGDDIWDRRGDLRGIVLDLEAALRLIERDLRPYIDEFRVQREDPGKPGVFFLNNTGFESVDAELLYAMVRLRRPRRVVELGSGYTSLLINMAARRNAGECADTSHEVYDPYPREHVIGETLTGPTHLEPLPATEVPLRVFDSLERDDILFVDTTHTVKLGSDVNHIVLDVLPRLSAGVIVHFHDIFLPWEYPRTWFADMHYFWTEQYLLQAFLAFNQSFEVILPAQALARIHPKRLASAIPSFGPGVSPASMWLRRCETSDDARQAVEREAKEEIHEQGKSIRDR